MNPENSKWAARVPEIKAMAGKKTARQMAEHFGVSLGMMGKICSIYGISTKMQAGTYSHHVKVEAQNEKELNYRAMVELTRRAWV